MNERLALAAMFMRDLGITGGAATKKSRIAEALNTADLLIEMEEKTRGKKVEVDDDALDLVGGVDEEPEEEPKKSPPAPRGDDDDLTLRGLGVSGRACAPLERMGVVNLNQLAVQERADIKEVKGVSRDSMKQFDELLEQHGLTWGMTPAEINDSVDVDDLEDDDEEDLL